MAGAKSTARTKKKPAAKPAGKSARATKPAKTTARARPKTKPAKSPARTSTTKTPARRPSAPSSSRGRASSGEYALDRLQQVALTATNLDASVAFYRDILGLRFITRIDPPGLAFFNLGGGLRLLLSATESQASLYFQVDDMDLAVKELRKRGVHFLQPPHMIQRDEAGDFGKKGVEEWMAFFHDPAGNLLALVERR